MTTSLVRVAQWSGEKQLVAAQDIASGAPVLGEYPIAFVETREGEDDLGPWLLLEGILSDHAWYVRVDAEDLKLTKWPLGADDESRLERLARTYKRNPKKLAQLYHRVAANNVRYQRDGVIGFGIWPTISRSNHSCDPNTQIRTGVQQPLAEYLVATRDIAAGSGICWNYLSDPAFLKRDWFARNAILHRDFQFLCRCERCESERPPGVAQLPRAELIAYFSRRGSA